MKFNIGQIVESDIEVILVTGKGKKSCGYPCFSGVIIYKKVDKDFWPVGIYSKTWSNNAFKETKIDLNALIAEKLKHKNK